MSDFELVTRHIVMEKDLNAFGNLFGGVMLAWLDEAAALYVMEKCGYANFVTVSLDDVNFKAPSHRGDSTLIYCRVLKTGRSSIIIQTKAYSYEPESREKYEVINCKFTFVCLKRGKPYNYFSSGAYQRWLDGKKNHEEESEASEKAEASS